MLQRWHESAFRTPAWQFFSGNRFKNLLGIGLTFLFSPMVD
jgi:hypothetical protein